MLKFSLQVIVLSERPGRIDTKRNDVKQLIGFMEIILIIQNCSYSNIVIRKYISSSNGVFDNLQKENVEVSLQISLLLTKRQFRP